MKTSNENWQMYKNSEAPNNCVRPKLKQSANNLSVLKTGGAAEVNDSLQEVWLIHFITLFDCGFRKVII